jgi:hypothetical protein
LVLASSLILAPRRDKVSQVSALNLRTIGGTINNDTGLDFPRVA